MESQFHCCGNLHFCGQFSRLNKIKKYPTDLRGTSRTAVWQNRGIGIHIYKKNNTYPTCASLRKAICDSSSAMRRFSCCINVLSSISSFLLRSKKHSYIKCSLEELLWNSCMAIMQYWANPIKYCTQLVTQAKVNPLQQFIGHIIITASSKWYISWPLKQIYTHST